MVSKNRKDITKHYTLRCTITITNGSIRNFPIATRFDKGKPRLLVSAVGLGEGSCVTFDSSKTETTRQMITD